MKILIMIPAYNEEDNILNTIGDLCNCEMDYDYVVINDCSTDKTLEILSNNKCNYLNLPINLGIGGGVQAGYRYAMEHGYDIAVQFDGDGQHVAKYIKDLIAPIVAGQADMTVGSRFIRKEGFQTSAMRRLGISFLSKLINLLCGIKITDVTSGMRAANKKMIAFFANNYAQDYPEPEAILTVGLVGGIVQEVPVEMRERQGGVSSINPMRSVYYMLKVSLALLISRISYGRKK